MVEHLHLHGTLTPYLLVVTAATDLQLTRLIDELGELAPERLKPAGLVILAHARSGLELGENTVSTYRQSLSIYRHLPTDFIEYIDALQKGGPTMPLPAGDPCHASAVLLAAEPITYNASWPTRCFIQAVMSCLSLIANKRLDLARQNLINTCVQSALTIGGIASDGEEFDFPSLEECAWQVEYLGEVLIHERPLTPIEDRLRKSPLAE